MFLQQTDIDVHFHGCVGLGGNCPSYFARYQANRNYHSSRMELAPLCKSDREMLNRDEAAAVQLEIKRVERICFHRHSEIRTRIPPSQL